jgi:hypothetical protein
MLPANELGYTTLGMKVFTVGVRIETGILLPCKYKNGIGKTNIIHDE